MRYKVLPKHLNLLNQFTLTEDGFVSLDEKMITESRMKEFLVSVIINGFFAQLRVGANSGALALAVVKKLFPHARTTGAYISA